MVQGRGKGMSMGQQRSFYWLQSVLSPGTSLGMLDAVLGHGSV